MIKRWLVPALILITLINVSALATFIYQRMSKDVSMPACPNMSEQTCRALDNRLDLSDAQAADLKLRQCAYRQRIDSLAVNLYRCRIELSECLLQEPTDAGLLKMIGATMDSLQLTMNHEVIKNLLEQKRYLNPAQQKIFFSMILKQCSMQGKSCCPN